MFARQYSTALIFVLFSLSLIPSKAPAAISLKTSAKPVTQRGVFDTYQLNRQENRPNYITADLWLVAYSLVRQRTLTETETTVIQPLLQSFLKTVSETISQHPKDAASDANRDYLAVLNALLSGEKKGLSKTAASEYARVLGAEGISPSPLWGYSIDYSQFKPRGRYTQSPESERYFRTMRYASGVLFAVTPSQSTGVDDKMANRMVQQALQLAEAAQKSGKPYAQLEELLAWQMGPADDLTTQDVLEVKKNLKAKKIGALRSALFDYAKKHNKQPRILSGLVDASKLEEGLAPVDVLAGWRLLPLRYSADSEVFQQLIYANTGAYKGDCKKCRTPFGLAMINGKPVKGFPSANELMALLGSQAAAKWIADNREDQFEGYQQATDKARAVLADVAGLKGAQLKLIKAGWVGETKEQDRTHDPLTTMLAFWTWQRYTNVLYSKQSYSMTGKSFSFSEQRAGALLEPATGLYEALVEIVDQHREITPNPNWNKFAQVLAETLSLSKKADKGEKFSAEDEQYLNDLDRALLALAGTTDKPIIVDVHSSPASAEVLEEGVGYARVVEKLKARGARMSHYEFKQPLAKRLTDEDWRLRLEKNKVTE